MKKLEITVDENDFESGIQEILSKVRPKWPANSVRFELFTDGLSNKLIGCFHVDPKTSQEEVVLVRIYGNNSDLLVDRDSEKLNIVFLHKHGLAPELYATFKNGLVYEYVPGCTLNSVTVKEPTIWSLVATNMAKMHKLSLNSEDYGDEPMLKTKTYKFLDLIPETYSDPETHKRVEASLPSKEKLRIDFDELYEALKELKSPIVFCHNDLNLSNLIYTAESEKITFIDFEYAEINFQAFDVGNHFVGYRVIDSNNQIDYSTYPPREYQLDWIRVYLEEFSESEVTASDVEKLYKQANKFALSSLFLGVLWGLIQAEHSRIDFDFILFATSRYDEYLARKAEFLSL